MENKENVINEIYLKCMLVKGYGKNTGKPYYAIRVLKQTILISEAEYVGLCVLNGIENMEGK